jgi:tRNA(adenine34) deaminase
MTNIETFMDIAIGEAKIFIKEGNNGFGAVIIKCNDLISQAHDSDKTSNDPTAHAEMTAIRTAAVKNNGDLSDCMLVSTHEPCPMCSAAVVWSGIKKIAFGYSIQESINQGRRRIDLSCKELFHRAAAPIAILRDIKKEDCAVLYNEQVRKSIRQLRDIDSIQLKKLSEILTINRLKWFSRQSIQITTDNCLDLAYRLFLEKLGINPDDALIVQREKDRLVIHSINFCPTLEACKILDLDTRVICKNLSEGPTQELLKQLNPKLRFKRNYDKIRPYAPYCEEMIILDVA